MSQSCGKAATEGTARLIRESGIPVETVKKLHEGRPNIVDLITNGQIQLLINSPAGKDSVYDDSYLRKTAIKHKVPYITTMAAAKAAAIGIRRIRENGQGEVRSLQEWHRLISDREA